MFEQPSLVSDKPPFMSLLGILGIFVVGFVLIGPLLGLVVAGLVYQGEGSLVNILSNLKGDEDVMTELLVMQGVAALVGLIIIPFIYIAFIEHKRIAAFFPSNDKLGANLLIIVVLWVFFIAAISPITAWNANVDYPDWLNGFEQWARAEEDKLQVLTNLLTNFKTPAHFAAALLVVAVLPALGEEFIFRGLIQRELWRGTRNPHLAIWTAALLFSAVHLQFYGFVPRLLLGALFGYLYYWSGTLWVPVFAHLVNNGLALLSVYLHQREVVDVNLEDSEAAPWPYVIVGVVVTTLLLYYFRKMNTPSPASYPESDLHS